jgi:hypothetical protein
VGYESAWIFPPARGLSQALSLLEKYRIEALVVMPTSKPSNKRTQLQNMGAQISGPFTVPKEENSTNLNMRVPEGTLNPAFLGLGVYRVGWS